MKNFDIFFNDKFKKEDDWIYESNVRSHWLDIVMEENNISEKDFKMIDKLSNLLDLYIDEHNDIYKTIVIEFEKQSSRYQFCAEHLYAINTLDIKNIIK